MGKLKINQKKKTQKENQISIEELLERVIIPPLFYHHN
jgi:hypothetical protein